MYPLAPVMTMCSIGSDALFRMDNTSHEYSIDSDACIGSFPQR
jgi:hypothetical protein